MYGTNYIAEELYSEENDSIKSTNFNESEVIVGVDTFQEKEVIVVKPTLRINEKFVDKPIAAQLILFNKDSISHNFVMILSLYSDTDKHIGTVNNMGILSGENEQVFNYCFEASQKSKKYKLKVAVNCEGESKYYNFELKAPK